MAVIICHPLTPDVNRITLDDATVRTIKVQARTSVRVAVPGVQGPPGSGADSLFGVARTIAYGDASPETIYTTDVSRLIVVARVTVEVAFDGVGAALAVGTPADHDGLVATSDIDLSTVGSYTVYPMRQLAAGTAVKATITPGSGATAGSASIILESYEVTP